MGRDAAADAQCVESEARRYPERSESLPTDHMAANDIMQRMASACTIRAHRLSARVG